MNNIRIVSLLIVISVLPLQSQTTHINVKGDHWDYKDDESNLGSDWVNIDYSQNQWKYGDAQFGYGNNDVTTYSRKVFNVVNASICEASKLKAIRDDGMIVYINGNEVWGDNIPSNHDYSTLANGYVAGSREDTFKKTIDNVLVTDNNIVAEEIHQVKKTSSDVSFDLKLDAYSNTDVGGAETIVIRQPYIQMVSPTNAIIKWRTVSESLSTIRYGTNFDSLTDSIMETNAEQDHEIKLTNLSPETTYFYEIANSNGVYITKSSESFVKTAPQTGDKKFVRAWILGDAGKEGPDQTSVRNSYYNYVSNTSTAPNQTDMILHLGDNAYPNGTF